MKFKVFFAWFDFWIGAYYDVGHRTLYVCPLPTIVTRFEFSGPKNELKHRKDRNQYKKGQNMSPGCMRLIGKDKNYVRRLENAFLMVYDLAGIDATPLPEALPESYYVPGYMDKVRELREVFALAKVNVQERDAETTTAG